MNHIKLYSFMFWSLSVVVSSNHDHHVWLDYSPSVNYILMGNLIYGFKWHPIQAWWISKAIKQESWKWLIQLFTLFFIHVGWVSIHISFHMVNNWFQSKVFAKALEMFEQLTLGVKLLSNFAKLLCWRPISMFAKWKAHFCSS